MASNKELEELRLEMVRVNTQIDTFQDHYKDIKEELKDIVSILRTQVKHEEKIDRLEKEMSSLKGSINKIIVASATAFLLATSSAIMDYKSGKVQNQKVVSREFKK